MRTIKFKGQKPSNGAWVYGCLVYSNEIDAAIYYQTGRGSVKTMDLVYVNPDTVCQFTGFLDKNGKEIYEGDVLRSDNFPYRNKKQDKYFAVVYYCEKAACFGIVMVKNTSSSSWGVLDGDIDGIDREKMQDFEVIGNVYDPEWKQYREYIQEEDEEQRP